MSQRIGKWRKYPPEVRQRALERMKACDNISELARELGIRRKWLYKWSEQERDAATRTGNPAASQADADLASAASSSGQEAKLRKQVQDLQSKVAQQSLEIDFFKGALQRIEQRRRNREATTAPASTSKSEA